MAVDMFFSLEVLTFYKSSYVLCVGGSGSMLPRKILKGKSSEDNFEHVLRQQTKML